MTVWSLSFSRESQMRVQSHETFKFNLSSEHIGVILEGLAELPYKKVNPLIKYMQQQMQQQLTQQAEVKAVNEKAAKKAHEEQALEENPSIEEEIDDVRKNDPELAAAISKDEAGV